MIKTESMRAVAYIAARIANQKVVGNIYDYQAGTYFNINGEVTPNHVNVFDYSASNYITGNSSNGSFNLFNYDTSNYVQLKVKQNNFDGFDYASSSFFSGTVTPLGAVSFFDYSLGRYFNFQV